jgi:pSer/pThr/pTyr-binding forkhead associated (FHA) protein
MFNTKLKLLVVRGIRSGQLFTVVDGGSRLGRSGSCEISIDDPQLSRKHCLFDYIHGELWLTDLASTNGTFVNGEVLSAKSVVLHKYDLITLGEHTDLIVMSSRAAKRYLRRHTH